MGNKLCKKKVDTDNNPKSGAFDRIITRLHLRPQTWKSDSDPATKAKSSNFTDVPLDKSDEPIHLKNPKLSIVFDNDKEHPVPPPRKHKGIREKLEAVAKTGLQSLQPKTNKPVDEPLCVKKTINYTCPLDEHDCAIHNHKHKMAKRRKNLSVVSLPNFEDLKLSVQSLDFEKASEASKSKDKMTRCRSFGSLLPQQLLEKLKVRKIPMDTESDDSFGALEDWDLRILEHYNPKETSLPRQQKPRSKNDVLSDVEDLVVVVDKPEVPARRSESLLKKLNREAAECAMNERLSVGAHSTTPPPSPEKQPEEENRIIKKEDLPPTQNEHSSLMKILEEYSRKEVMSERQKIEDFLYNEKV